MHLLAVNGHVTGDGKQKKDSIITSATKMNQSQSYRNGRRLMRSRSGWKVRLQ